LFFLLIILNKLLNRKIERIDSFTGFTWKERLVTLSKFVLEILHQVVGYAAHIQFFFFKLFAQKPANYWSLNIVFDTVELLFNGVLVE